jgi:imidazolonepropionase-like amidohydrolase
MQHTTLKTKGFWTSLFSLALLFPFSLTAQQILLHCGTLIDGVGNEVQTEMTVVVEGKKIVKVVKGYQAPQGKEQVIDLKNKTVLPGLIDLHVHLESETSKDQLIKRFTYNQADIAFEAQKHALTTLMAGFTTVRDLGGTGVNISLRNAINRGTVSGPRIFTSGKTISTTGGHGDPTNAFRQDLKVPDEATNGVVDSPDEARKAVRQRYKDGVDCIKITATGGVLSIAKSGKAPQFEDQEAEAIVKTARDYGFHVAAHAHGAEGMKRAIKAGVTTIEHGTFMDDEAIALFTKYGTW